MRTTSPARSAALGLAGVGALLLARAALRRRRAVDFENATVLVTGGSRGLGLHVAEELARRGAHVAICARGERGLALARALLRERTGADVLALRCDVAVREDVERAVAACLRAWGSVDVLVNCAGVIQVGPLECMTHEDFERALDVHVRGPLNAILATLPSMRRRGGGRIVNVASFGGRVAVPHMAPYCASKFALVGLSEALRTELVRDHVLVTTVTPGLMRTGGERHAQFKGRHASEFAWFAVAASTPWISISVRRAARRIVEACRRGDPTLSMPWIVRAAEAAHALAPRATAGVLHAVARALPDAEGEDSIGARSASGAESRPDWLPGWATALGDRAARAQRPDDGRDGAPDVVPRPGLG